MKLSEYQKDAFLAWMYAERYVNDGSPSGFTHYGSVDPEYCPGGNEGSFGLPVYAMGREEVTAIGNPSAMWQDLGIHDAGGSVPFPIHPAVLLDLKNHEALRRNEAVKVVGAIPTASVRTVAVRNNDGASFWKLHFPRTIGRFVRDLPLYKWLASIDTSREIVELLSSAPKCMAVLPVIGGVFLEGGAGIAGFGAIQRSAIPYPEKQGAAFMIPCFSLWSKDRTRNGDATMLRQLISKYDYTALQAIESFVGPILRSYRYLAVECGMIPEYNAQNVLFEIQPDSGLIRVVHRDMCDVFKDSAARPLARKRVHPLATYHTTGDGDYGDLFARRSFAYDFKLSQYVLDPMVNEIADCCGHVVGELKEDVKRMAHDIVAWPADYFESSCTGYCYPRKGDVGRNSYEVLEVVDYR